MTETTTGTTTSKTRTITLTGRPPVRIREDAWPVLASASYHDYDGQYDFQAAEHYRGRLTVRQHADGRAVVYAVCTYDTAWVERRGYEQRAGDLLPAGSLDDIIEAIRRVHASIDIVDEDHMDMWRLLADECIADLPAEEI